MGVGSPCPRCRFGQARYGRLREVGLVVYRGALYCLACAYEAPLLPGLRPARPPWWELLASGPAAPSPP